MVNKKVLVLSVAVIMVVACVVAFMCFYNTTDSTFGGMLV